MPGNTLLEALPLWALFLLVFVVILFSHESGFRLGRVRGHRGSKENDAPVGGMVAAELGLLAFLLAFTFGIAVSRFDVRREVLLDESNAIGTAYLRAVLLPEPHRAQVRQNLREYVVVRIAATPGESIDHAIRRSEELHRRLWAEAVAAAEKDPRSIPTGLFVQTLNEVIDLHAKRVTEGLWSRIPTTVWIVLFAVAVLSFAAMGYQSGLTGTRRPPVVFVVALTFALVIWLVTDLDRPGQGLIRVSQQPMIDLRRSMEVQSR
ncbi:MAG: bestrophin-like domain [Candidatus Loosdrechtia sp.]|uniref:bestrophin-like domain n=1 Tax=Candidatus Loosdrechtia sp. TaxID=3101272 RepID=UPI003A5EDB31|nr:MAG: hypothetical protein QY305_08665 [Candidatus Jettenia sp. AMX2]